jgi:hypothetical protein
MRVLILASCVLPLLFARANAQCLGDFNGDGKVTVDELVTAVDNVMNGCQITGARFVDNGDGTVTDLNTSLQWEKKDNLDDIANEADPHDADNTYAWCSGDPETGCTNRADPADGTAYTDFLAKLNGVSANGCFAGQCDWRLPTVGELYGILDSSQRICGGSDVPCIDPVFGPTKARNYLSRTTSSANPAVVKTVFFGDGGFGTNAVKIFSVYVRAVRGGS